MILIVGPSPSYQRRMKFARFAWNQVNRAEEVETLASGKGINCARAVHHLCGEARTLLFLGGVSGDAIRQSLREEDIPWLDVPTKSPTRSCCTIQERETGGTAELVENAGPVSETEIRAFGHLYGQQLASAKVVVLIGTLPPGIPTTWYRELTERAVAKGIPVIVDAHGEVLMRTLPGRPTLVKPNQDELAAATGLDLTQPGRKEEAARRLAAQTGQWVFVSNGAEPALLTDGQTYTLLGPPKVQAVNPVGSGDSTAAGIAMGLWHGMEMKDAICWGMACGASNAASLGYGRLDAHQVPIWAEQMTVERLPTLSTEPLDSQ